jgi:hypothetical protein
MVNPAAPLARFVRTARALIAVAGIGLSTLAACRGKPGDDCTETPTSCLDNASHLACVKGKYVLEPCKGKGGCKDDKSLICDNSWAAVGDGCSRDGARACSSDGAKELRCHDGQFAIEWSCRGGCALDDSSNPKCMPTGEVGEACRSESIVCDGVQRTQLACIDGKLAPQKMCHGALGCKTEAGGGVRCDRTQALEGEGCREDGTAACDMARKNVLVCRGGQFKPELRCLGPLGCELPGNYSVRCDKSIVEDNEPCTEDGSVACTAAGKQVKCKDGRFGIDKTWKPKKGETCDARYRISFETEKFEAR